MTRGRAAVCAVAVTWLVTPPVHAQPPSSEVVAALRIHGNYSIPDVDVLRLAGIAPGDRVEPDTLETIASRLRASGRFVAVDVRKRYTSLRRSDEVALILLVEERPVSSDGRRRVLGPGAVYRGTADDVPPDPGVRRGPWVQLRRTVQPGRRIW